MALEQNLQLKLGQKLILRSPADGRSGPRGQGGPRSAADEGHTGHVGRRRLAYFFGEYLNDGYRPRAPRDVKELPPIENTLATGSSLADHLTWQLSAQTGDAVVQSIGAAIIGNLDEAGYLVEHPERGDR